VTTAADIEFEWVHVQYAETGGFAEVYGFSGNQGMVNLEGVRMRPRGRPSKTLMIYMHPASTLQLLPVPRAAVAEGAHVLCAASRYARNDAPLILEKVVLDLGAYVRHAGAGLACPEFPTCLGRWLPLQMGHEVLIHYSHRFLALLIIFTLVALAMAAFLDGKLRRHRPLVYSLLFLAVLQIGAGAGVVETGLNFAATAFHLAIALVMLLVLGRMWVLESSG